LVITTAAGESSICRALPSCPNRAARLAEGGAAGWERGQNQAPCDEKKICYLIELTRILIVRIDDQHHH
jgi:hypothetical protein